MTDKIKKLAVPILLVLVIVFATLWMYSEASKSVSFGGLVHNTQEIFSFGIKAGSSAEEVINSSGVWTGSISQSSSDSSRLYLPTFGGAVAALTSGGTVTSTAAQICDNSVLTFTPTGTITASTTLPTITSMYADCLTTNGDTHTLLFRNLSGATSTILRVADASSTLVGVAATDDLVGAGNEVLLRFIRYSATEMIVAISKLVAAD